MIPKLWTSDLDGAVKWIREFIAQQNVGGGLTQVEGEAAPVTSESAGMARVWLGVTVPTGWLPLDGSYIFITEAPDLYAEIGLTYDPAPPANMFKLPPAPSALASGAWIIKS